MEAPAEANPKVTPTKPHFFKPILPSFHQGLLIPVHFYKHYLNDLCKLKNNGMAVLRTVLGAWKVKINDGRFEDDGWRDFAHHHSLHVGDMVVFRYEGDLVFDVMVFDPTACERFYHNQHHQTVKQESSLEIPTNDLQWSKDKADSPVRATTKKADITLDPQAYPSFVSTVYPDNIKSSRFSIPQQFAKSHGLSCRKCEIMIIDDEHERKSWLVNLIPKSNGQVIIRGNGCRDFIVEHGLKVGDSFSLELISRGAKPIMVFHALRSKTDVVAPSIVKESTKLKSKALERLTVEKEPMKLPLQASHCFISTLTESNIKNCYLRIPSRFARFHGLKESCEMTIKDPNQRLWTVSLKKNNMRYEFRLLKGLKEVFVANKLKQGQDIKLELVKGCNLLMLHLTICGSRKDTMWNLEVNKDSVRLKSHFNVEKKPMELPSLDSHCCISTLTEASIKRSYLVIPNHFARLIGLKQSCQMTLIDPNRRLWRVSLRRDTTLYRFRLIKDWKEIVVANSLKHGQDIKLELVKRGELVMLNLIIFGGSEGGKSGVCESKRLVPGTE